MTENSSGSNAIENQAQGAVLDNGNSTEQNQAMTVQDQAATQTTAIESSRTETVSDQSDSAADSTVQATDEPDQRNEYAENFVTPVRPAVTDKSTNRRGRSKPLKQQAKDCHWSDYKNNKAARICFHKAAQLILEGNELSKMASASGFEGGFTTGFAGIVEPVKFL